MRLKLYLRLFKEHTFPQQNNLNINQIVSLVKTY
jgi:hypothetical protein